MSWQVYLSAAGTAILGDQERPFWNDHLGAGVNAIRTRTLIEKPTPWWCVSASSTGSGTPRSTPGSPRRWASR